LVAVQQIQRCLHETVALIATAQISQLACQQLHPMPTFGQLQGAFFAR